MAGGIGLNKPNHSSESSDTNLDAPSAQEGLLPCDSLSWLHDLPPIKDADDWLDGWPDSESASRPGLPAAGAPVAVQECPCPGRLSNQLSRLATIKLDVRAISDDVLVGVEADVRFERERSSRCQICSSGSNRTMVAMLLCMVLESMICMFEMKLRLPVGHAGVSVDPNSNQYPGPARVPRGSKKHLYRQLTVLLLGEHLNAMKAWRDVLDGPAAHVCGDLVVRIERILNLDM
jgi:hypothetical protein